MCRILLRKSILSRRKSQMPSIFDEKSPNEFFLAPKTEDFIDVRFQLMPSDSGRTVFGIDQEIFRNAAFLESN